jgi:AcrR family transcriptional regulator
VGPEAENQARFGEGQATFAPPFDDSPRGRVLKGMVEVIAHGGYRDATVDRVLEQAHVGWDQFVELFGDLDACFLAAADGGMAWAAAEAERAVAEIPANAGVEAVFEPALRAVLECAAANPSLTTLCLVEAPALGMKALEQRDAGLQRFVDLIVRRLGGESSTARPAPPSLAAEMVVGGIYEVLQRKVRAGETAELPQLANELRQLWLPALRGA